MTSKTKTENLFWRRVDNELNASARSRRIVNLTRLARHTKEGDVVVVPGKVLGDGFIDHKLTIAAQKFSASALKKLKDAKCTVMTINDFKAKNVKGPWRLIG